MTISNWVALGAAAIALLRIFVGAFFSAKQVALQRKQVERKQVAESSVLARLAECGRGSAR